MSKSSKGKALTDFDVSIDVINEAFDQIIFQKPALRDLRTIFSIAINDLSLFPNINNASSYCDYLKRWVRGYEEALLNIPSRRTANPKTSCSDPAIKTIVQYVTDVDDDTAEMQSAHHNLFMSAENIQGNLLEEYINSSIKEFGWYWCAGNVLRAVDFCTPNGSTLLQIKNKSNTENSSSSAIRTGTTIQKWYRLGTKTVHGIKVPDYKWEALNAIINAHSCNPAKKCSMSEKDYLSFLEKVARDNPQIITDK